MSFLDFILQILDVEDAPEFDPEKWWENGVSLDPNLIRFELRPGRVYVTHLVCIYGDREIGFEVYDFESSAKEVLNRLNEKLSIAQTNNFKVHYFPVTFLENKELLFEDGFVLLSKEKGGKQVIMLKMTTIGAFFRRDYSHPPLGETWCDPTGLCWGDIVKNKDGSIRYIIQSYEYYEKDSSYLPQGGFGAKEYCESIGARLPSIEEFVRLREYMGARPGIYEGYRAQVLPNLSGYWFWSSSVYPSFAERVYAFSGVNGNIELNYRNNYIMVRCVVGR